MSGGGGGGRRLLLAAMVIMVVVEARVVMAAGCDKPVLFNFGDSNSDTGGVAAGIGYQFPLPEGRLFFNRSTGRLCDGRLIIDFLCESLKTGFLNAYLDSLSPGFTNGANFAVAGASTQPRDRPFSLSIQVNQFLRFKIRSLELLKQGSRNLIDEEGFKNALYMMDIGQNDLAGPVNLTYDQIIVRIPSVLTEIKSAIKKIFDSGGKNFWVHNISPIGCMPQKLALPRKDDSELDPYGCLMPLNNAAKEFNARLSDLCNELSSELTNVTIVYTDIYAIKYDLIANYTTYRFESPVRACCGFGGPPYNYNQNITCGNPGFQVCPEGSRLISWDGVHYTEAANEIVTSKILSTNYSKPSVSFDFFCNT